MFVWECDVKYLFQKLNLSKSGDQNVKILGRRLYSRSLKDAAWLEDVRLIFLIFHTLICTQIWLGRQTSRRSSRENIYGQMCCKFTKKNSSATYSNAKSFKLGEYNLLPSILMF